MSTVKTDAIVAVSTNGDLSLDGLGTGGVSIASTLKMTKGGDISSASPLVIDVDGNYFDVTGTTNFAAMTVESGNFFMLQFDGALTITHGSGIELPGASNLTTAAGDRLICYATAANTVEVMSVELETAASAGGFSPVSSQTISDDATIDFSGFASGNDYFFAWNEIEFQTDAQKLSVRFAVSGPTFRASGYFSTAWNYGGTTTSTTGIIMCRNTGSNVAGEGNYGGFMYVNDPANASFQTTAQGINTFSADSGGADPSSFGGTYDTSEAHTDIRFIASSGNLTTGRITMYSRSIT
jgi:hypothetical protein